ncbi:hypothetical protein F4604DRAFT_1722877 [Suillus subluteus]|nr:hypothetical protein F4604DRAFT_1722877 [Suillus subluteus]
MLGAMINQWVLCSLLLHGFMLIQFDWVWACRVVGNRSPKYLIRESGKNFEWLLKLYTVKRLVAVLQMSFSWLIRSNF